MSNEERNIRAILILMLVFGLVGLFMSAAEFFA